MTHTIRRPSSLLAFGAGLGAAVGLLAVSAPAGATALAAHPSAPSAYKQVNLVSDVPGMAQVTDPHLVNAWGASHLGASPLWVSDNGTDVDHALLRSRPRQPADHRAARREHPGRRAHRSGVEPHDVLHGA